MQISSSGFQCVVPREDSACGGHSFTAAPPITFFPLLQDRCMYTVTERTQFTATAAWLSLQFFFLIKELTSICLFKVGSLILLKMRVMPPLSAHYQMSFECFLLLPAFDTNAGVPGVSGFCYLPYRYNCLSVGDCT